jgi:uncharacterized protein YjdB
VLLAQTLQITAPADGALVYSGQTLTVTVNADPLAFQSVTVFSPDTEGKGTVLIAPPYQFSVAVSPETPSGPYKTILAMGIPPFGGSPVYTAIDVDIERPDLPQQLKLNLETIRFGFVGEEAPQSVTGVFADGSLVGLESSTYISYTSDTPAVATVDWRGMVTAVAPGKANITINYTTPSAGSISAQVPVTVPPPIVVLPSASSLYLSQSEPLAASLAIDPALDQSVTWSMSPQLGSIDQTGNYTAPSTVPSWTGVTVTATSVADPTKSASAQIWIFPPVSIGITPPSATLSAGQLQVFTARIQNGDFDANLSIDPSGIGTFLPFHGNTDPVTYTPVAGAEYYAPSSISSQQTLTITATSVADSSKTASAQITLVPSAAVAVSPVDPTVYALQTLRFTATINSGSSGTITWSLNPNIGTITAAGLYTAPSYIVAQQAVTVTAAGPSFGQTGTSILTLVPRNSAAIAVPTNLIATTTSNTEIDLSWAGSSEPGGTIAGGSGHGPQHQSAGASSGPGGRMGGGDAASH